MQSSYAHTATTKRITFYDLRATGITWEVLARTEHVRVQHRAGRKHFATTALYIREAETLGVAVGEPFPPLPASSPAPSEGPAGPTLGAMVTQVTGTKEETSNAHRFLEALGVGEHVDVGENVGGGLGLAAARDFSKLLDGRIFVARLVTGGAGQAVIGDLALG